MRAFLLLVLLSLALHPAGATAGSDDLAPRWRKAVRKWEKLRKRRLSDARTFTSKLRKIDKAQNRNWLEQMRAYRSFTSSRGIEKARKGLERLRKRAETPEEREILEGLQELFSELHDEVLADAEFQELGSVEVHVLGEVPLVPPEEVDLKYVSMRNVSRYQLQFEISLPPKLKELLWSGDRSIKFNRETLVVAGAEAFEDAQKEATDVIEDLDWNWMKDRIGKTPSRHRRDTEISLKKLSRKHVNKAELAVQRVWRELTFSDPVMKKLKPKITAQLVLGSVELAMPRALKYLDLVTAVESTRDHWLEIEPRARDVLTKAAGLDETAAAIIETLEALDGKILNEVVDSTSLRASEPSDAAAAFLAEIESTRAILESTEPTGFEPRQSSLEDAFDSLVDDLKTLEEHIGDVHSGIRMQRDDEMEDTIDSIEADIERGADATRELADRLDDSKRFVSRCSRALRRYESGNSSDPREAQQEWTELDNRDLGETIEELDDVMRELARLFDLDLTRDEEEEEEEEEEEAEADSAQADEEEDGSEDEP